MTTQTLWDLPVLTVDQPNPRWVNDRCRLEPAWDETRVYIGSVLFSVIPLGDAYQAKFVAAQLVILNVASHGEVAQAFGYSESSLRAWVMHLRRTGTLRPDDFKRGPVGPHKMTAEIFRYLTTHPARSHRDMADQIAQRFDVRLSPETIRFYRLRAQDANPPSLNPVSSPPQWVQEDWIPENVALEAEESAVPTPVRPRTDPESDPEPSIDPLPAVLPPPPGMPTAPQERVTAIGFWVLSPYLAALALPQWTTDHPWTEPHQFSPLSVVLAWVLAFLLGCRSAEGTKMGPRPDWGFVIGASHYPHPDTLRMLTHTWSDRGLGATLAAHCGPRYLSLFPEAPAIVYLDGHFIPYSGHTAYAGKGYSTLRRTVLAGHEQFWAHDGQGHPLWVEEAAGDASFYQAIVKVSQRVHQWRLGRLLVVYDRGGVAHDTAAALLAAGMDFLCYGKTRAVPTTAEWVPLTLTRAGRTRTYEVWEHTRRWESLPTVREIWVRDGDQTFPVLTSESTHAIAELLTALWGRWSQENGFKLLVQDYGLNHFGDRGTVPLADRPVPNPQRARRARELAKIDQALGNLRRKYPHPHALEGIDPDAPKAAHTRWTRLHQRLTAVQAAYEATPETVALWDLVPEERRQAFHYQTKAFQDACRVIAMNGEYWLRQRLAAVYPDPRHERRLVRWLLQAGGTVHHAGTVLTITLDRPARPRWAQAVADLLALINAQNPRHPADSRYTLHFVLKPAQKLKFSHKH